MYFNPYHYYPVGPPTPAYPTYTVNYPVSRTYPSVDTKIFEGSIKSFRLLMEQGSILLDRLGNVSFARKIMSAAQQGKNAEVDQLIKTIGLKVPVVTHFTPTGVNFTLTTQVTQQQPIHCCTLTVAMQWGH
ncbi:hypothetical protein [Neobacillus cucumis]|uniref:hypothetical protein n=1 Tax=Neobacillus cucumis TaxID=1740721 RepID=UPI001964C494|nr:hypothetical protein [Neobacillus cucumis]MBM7650801.1 hypothetical protein [Neobacillus cucumis]